MNERELNYLREYQKINVLGCPKCKGANLYCSCYTDYFNKLKVVKANVPFQFLDWTFEMFDSPDAVPTVKKVKKYVEDIDKNYKSGKGVYIYGSVGNGKTCFASVILRHVINKGYSGCFMTLDQCMALLREREEGTASIEERLSKESLSADFLVIDEMNTRYSQIPSPSVKATFEELIRSRTNRLLPLIVTSNIVPQGVEKNFGGKIKSLFDAFLENIKTEVEFDCRAKIRR